LPSFLDGKGWQTKMHSNDTNTGDLWFFRGKSLQIVFFHQDGKSLFENLFFGFMSIHVISCLCTFMLMMVSEILHHPFIIY